MFIKKKACNKKYYFHKNKRYVINTELHMLFFIPIYCTCLFLARIHIPFDQRSCGILVQNKLVQ